MDLSPNQFFHIFNQGNNKRQIFFNSDDYEFFLWKIKGYMTPFGDVVSWCLMPNHFHIQFYVIKVDMERKEFFSICDAIEYERRVLKYGKRAKPVRRAENRRSGTRDKITLNEAIGILESSYTQMINKREGWSGSLFRMQCKAKKEELEYSQSSQNKIASEYGNDYAYNCLRYIHQNPVKAGMVSKEVDYEWSSAKDYAGLRSESICNLEMGQRIIRAF